MPRKTQTKPPAQTNHKTIVDQMAFLHQSLQTLAGCRHTLEGNPHLTQRVDQEIEHLIDCLARVREGFFRMPVAAPTNTLVHVFPASPAS